MKRSIAIILPFNSPEEFYEIEKTYYDSHVLLGRLAKERNMDIRWVFGEDNFVNGKFSRYWLLEDTSFVKYEEPYKADLLVPRFRSHKLDNERRLNNPEVSLICRDKWKSYETFPKFMKKTVILNPDTVLEVKKFSTDKVIVKPRFGFWGQDVRLEDKNNINQEYISALNGEYIAQEFIDSSGGIENVIDKRHELRIYLFDNEIKSAYIRVPAEGSYLSNISQGATEMMITLNQIPQSSRELVALVDSKFQKISPRLYSIDIMYEDNVPFIVELNDSPGFPDAELVEFTTNWHNALLDLLTK